jgi:Spy/CpxP family protein refolding chaperone
MRRTTLLAAAALLAAMPAAGQEGQHAMPMMQDPMHACMAMMGGPPPAMLLHHREALGLTDDQVSRLEALGTQEGQPAMPHMQPAMQAHHAAAELLKADAPDFAAYEAKLREAADHMVLGHVAMARTAVAARQILTAEQRTKLETLRPAGMEKMQHDPAAMERMHETRPHNRDGEQMHAGMMMHCMAMAPGGQHKP